MNCRRVPCKLPQRGAGVGVETKKQRKEGERTSGKRKGTRARTAKDTSLRGRGCIPAPRSWCAPPLGRSAPGREQGRGIRRQHPPLAQPRPSRRASRGCRALSGSGATASAACPVGGRGLRGLPRVPRSAFHAPTAGGGTSG